MMNGRVKVCCLAVIFLGMFAFSANAVENELGLDTKFAYDIYLGSTDNGGVIVKGVQIVGMRQVKEQYFVVIQTDDFAGKKSEGLIALDRIQAVLPTFSLTSSSNTRTINR